MFKINVFILFTIVTLFFVESKAIGQNTVKAWVYFQDKGCQDFNPQDYFHKDAIDRRIKMNLDLHDESDFPVNESYIGQIDEYTSEIRVRSRWLNAVSCEMEIEDITSIEAFPFVERVEVFSEVSQSICRHKSELTTKDYQEEIGDAQIDVLGDSLLKANNLDGEGITIAVFDVGFNKLNSLPAFQHLFDFDLIRETYDFVKDEEYVYSYDSHGTSVVSCIAGSYKGQDFGLATKAKFLLARTERGSFEFSNEEDNWIAAAEWADKNGAHIISSSLGYTYHRYFKKDLDGKTSPLSRVATIAARKGILVINAAGNERNDSWEFICIPADADSVLAVGGIDPWTGVASKFSSKGPSSDLRLKPNVCAFGTAFTANPSGNSLSDGTSFAAPLIAGLAACIWQKNPEWTNMQVYEAIEKSGSLYPYFDYLHGYGVPSADRIFSEPIVNDSISIHLEKTEGGLRLTVEPFQPDFNLTTIDYGQDWGYVYYHILDENNIIQHYAVVDPFEKFGGIIPLQKLNLGSVLKIHYRGKTEIYELEK